MTLRSADEKLYFIQKFLPRPTFWYITCLNRSKNNKDVALNVGRVSRLTPKLTTSVRISKFFPPN